MSGMHRNRVSKRILSCRRIIQAMAAVFLNGYAAGFAQKRIFTGRTKAVCVPVLNCYSCPGAMGSCPIGALQAVVGGVHGRFPFYVLGTLMLFGILLGRTVCGFLCPFGLIQDLLHKVPHPRVNIPKRLDQCLRWLKYIILVVMVLLLPAFAGGITGVTPPYFCEYICPAGTLEGGIPLVLLNDSLRAIAGALFQWKVSLLILILAGAVLIPRFFCRYLCPLGAFYAVFQRFSFVQMKLDREKCVGCGKCEKICPMQVDVTKNINSPECIRCGECAKICSASAISIGIGSVEKNVEESP